MSSPASIPLRVLVKRRSSVRWISMMGGPRSDMTYPRVTEQELLAGGRPAVVRNAGRLAWPTHHLFKTWDEETVAWSPDIAILAVGHCESLHITLPRWLERGANTVSRRSGLLRHLDDRRLPRALARFLLIVRKAIDHPEIKRARRMRRVISDARAEIAMTSQVGNPLSLLMKIQLPSGVKRDWYGGWATTTHRLKDDLRSLVADTARPDVRFVESTHLADWIDLGDPESLWADGTHFSPAFHRAIGEEWSSNQSHLAQP